MKFSFIGNESLCIQAVAEGFLESPGSISMLGSFLVCISSCLPFPSLMFSWIQGSNNPLGKSAIGRKERGSSRLELCWLRKGHKAWDKRQSSIMPTQAPVGEAKIRNSVVTIALQRFSVSWLSSLPGLLILWGFTSSRVCPVTDEVSVYTAL